MHVFVDYFTQVTHGYKKLAQVFKQASVTMRKYHIAQEHIIVETY